MVKLYVAGFPRSMEEMQLAELFSPYGRFTHITLVRDRATGASKGFGFIEMDDLESCNQAIQALNGTFIGDRELNVRIAEDKPASAKKSFFRPRIPGERQPQTNAPRIKRPRRPM